MASLIIDQVRKSFGPIDVLSDVSLDIADGEFVVLVGPSGCGKSTLLRIIAGLEAASDGVVRLGDRVLNTLAPKDRNIAMVFQSYALYPHMSVAENMGFGLKMRGEGTADIGRQVSAAAQILALESLLDRFPRQLSGGQRQRVAMGRAIVRNPEVFLFDEPLSNLDAKLRVQMRTEIRELQQRLETTTVYVTHDQVEAMTMADKIVVMNGGRIEQVGTPLALYDQPANLFVAEFLGSPGMNLLDGRVELEGRPRFVVGADAAFQLDNAALPAGDAVLGFRPEHLRIVEQGVPARIVAVEPTGLDTILVIELGGHQITGIFRQRFALRPGDRIEVFVAPEHIHLFDRMSGRRHAST